MLKYDWDALQALRHIRGFRPVEVMKKNVIELGLKHNNQFRSMRDSYSSWLILITSFAGINRKCRRRNKMTI